MFDLMLISLFFSMLLAPCVIASVSLHREAKTAYTAVRRAAKFPGRTKS